MAFLTLTIPHGQSMELQRPWDVVANGWRAMWAGRGGQEMRKRCGVVGYVRALEVTDGSNGWHPHLHVLVFLQPGADPRKLGAEVTDRWGDWVQRALGQRPSRQHGVTVLDVRGGEAVALYLSKVQDDGLGTEGLGGDGGGWGLALELTRHDLKVGRRKGRTPFQLLAAALDDLGEIDARCRARWSEWERVSKGRRAITWSRGLRDLLGLGLEVEDEEAAYGKLDGIAVATLPRRAWNLAERLGVTVDLVTAVDAADDERAARIVAAWLSMWRPSDGVADPLVVPPDAAALSRWYVDCVTAEAAPDT